MTWWDAVPAADLVISCSGDRHRLQWSRGEIQLVDHPDLDAELALVALGGDEPACLAHLQLWEDAVTDGGFLAEWVDEANLTPARLSWLAMALERMASEGFHEFLRDLPLKRAERMGHFLHRFPRPWLDRAAVTVSSSVIDGEGVGCVNAPQLLATAVSARLRRSFVHAVGGTHLSVGTAALVPLTIAVEAERAPSITGCLRGADRGVSIEVGPQWLHRVWGAGLSVVDGKLVLGATLAAEPVSEPTAMVSVVEWDDAFTPALEQRSATFLKQRWALTPLGRC